MPSANKETIGIHTKLEDASLEVSNGVTTEIELFDNWVEHKLKERFVGYLLGMDRRSLSPDELVGLVKAEINLSLAPERKEATEDMPAIPGLIESLSAKIAVLEEEKARDIGGRTKSIDDDIKTLEDYRDVILLRDDALRALLENDEALGEYVQLVSQDSYEKARRAVEAANANKEVSVDTGALDIELRGLIEESTVERSLINN